MTDTIATTIVSVLGTLLVVAGLGALFVRWQIGKARDALRGMHSDFRRDPAPVEELGSGYSREEPAPAAKVALPVVTPPRNRCDACESWSLEAGQKIMDAHPPFRAAAQWRQPWQMGLKRNREFIELEKEIFELEKTLGDGKALELRAKLEKIQEWITPDVTSSMKIGWQDFGVCVVHHELRARTDACDRFKREAP